MFFHSIVRVDNKINVGEQINSIFENEKYIIFPIVSPKSEIGIFLINPENSVFLSEYSGDYADIVYISEDSHGNYSEFIKKVLNLIEENTKAELNEPAIIIFDKDKSQIIIFDNFAKSGVQDFKKLLIQMIDALRSKRPFTNLKILKAKAAIDLKNVVTTLISLIKDAIIISHG
jgi:hypothetical protein